MLQFTIMQNCIHNMRVYRKNRSHVPTKQAMSHFPGFQQGKVRVKTLWVPSLGWHYVQYDIASCRSTNLDFKLPQGFHYQILLRFLRKNKNKGFQPPSLLLWALATH